MSYGRDSFLLRELWTGIAPCALLVPVLVLLSFLSLPCHWKSVASVTTDRRPDACRHDEYRRVTPVP